jgi:hypothetical protein
MSWRHWESTSSSVWRRKTPLPLSSQEVPLGGGEIGFVNAPLTSSEVQNFKKKLWPLLKDPFRVSEQVDQFLGPQICTWAELMSIREFSSQGRKEPWYIERQWLSGSVNIPPGQSVLVADVKSPNQDPQWINTPGYWENIRELRDLIRGDNQGEEMNTTITFINFREARDFIFQSISYSLLRLKWNIWDIWSVRAKEGLVQKK